MVITVQNLSSAEWLGECHRLTVSEEIMAG